MSRAPDPESFGVSSAAYLAHLAGLGAAGLHPFGTAATVALLEALDPRVGERVLDLGCGPGRTLGLLGRRPGLLPVGVERLPEMLNEARGRSARSRPASPPLLVRADARRLPFREAAFDRAFAESVLGFQAESDCLAMIGEIRRVLRPGGLFVANEAIWRPGVPQELASSFHAAAARDFGLFQVGERAWSVTEWSALFREHGFEVLAAERVEERIAAIGSRSLPRDPWRERAALRLRRLLSGLRPAVRRARARYRRMEREHADKGRWVEARLFVVRRLA